MRDLQGWRAFGKCRTLTYEQVNKMFFYGSGGSPVRGRRFCSTCPVKNECRDFAILYEEVGLWGGTTDDERAMIRSMMPEYVLLLRKEAQEKHRLEIRESVNALGLRAARSYPAIDASSDSDSLETLEGPTESQLLAEQISYTQLNIEIQTSDDWWQTTVHTVYTVSLYTSQDATESPEPPRLLESNPIAEPSENHLKGAVA